MPTANNIHHLLLSEGYIALALQPLLDQLLLLYCTIAGQAMQLVVDSGATHTCLDAATAQRRLQLKTSDTPTDQVVGVGTNKGERSLCMVSNWQLGSLVIPQFAMSVIDLQHINQALQLAQCPPIDGVLGADVLHTYQAYISYANHHLYLHPGIV